jgi:phage protein D
VSNDFTVFSQSAAVNPPIRAEAADTNAASPTYVDGTFGDIPTFLSSSTLTDMAGAEAAAQAQLLLSLGQVDTLTVSTLPNPAVEVDDVFTVTRSRAGLVGDQWTIDGYTLGAGTSGIMTLNLRKVVLL